MTIDFLPETDTFRRIDPADFSPRDIYFLLTAIVIPRPIAWISTIAPDGTFNAAPHSFTTVLSSDPPIVCFVSSGIKDSMRNARDAGDFVYNIAGENQLEQLNITAANLPRDESEFDWASLTPVASDLVKSPRIGEAPISLETKLVQIERILESDHYLVAGLVVRLHVAERIFTDERIDPAKLRPVGRLSGSAYSLQGELVSLKRPTHQTLIDAGVTPTHRNLEPARS